MALYEVTVSELRNAASKIGTANEAFRDAAAALKAASDALAATWEGPSQRAFVDEQQQIDVWYKQMADVVDTYVSSMQSAAEDYERTDAEAATHIRSK